MTDAAAADVKDRPDVVSPADDAVSSTDDAVSPGADEATPAAAPDGDALGADTGSKATQSDATHDTTQDGVTQDEAAAHAEFIAQFPSTDPDAENDNVAATDASAEPAAEEPADRGSEVKGETSDGAPAVAETLDAQADAVDSADAGDGERDTTPGTAPEAEADAASDANAEADDVETEADSADADAADDGTSEAADDVVDDDGTSEAAAQGTDADDANAAPEADVADADDVETDGASEVAAQEPEPDADTTGPETATQAPEPDTAAAEPVDATPAPDPDPAIPAAAALDPDIDGTDDPDEDFDDEDASSWVRPYVWTGGRTETSLDFAVETLVSAREQVAGAAIRDEHRRVLELCQQPRSITEIAALLSVPLGVAKTLLGAMVEEDLVVVHRTSGSAAGPDLALMERVLRGLKRL